MHRQSATRPLSVSQVLSAMAIAVALYCLVAFGTKSIEAYRLTKWRSELQLEVDGLERQAQVLRQEIERRQSPEWYDQVLREAGRVPQDAVRVIVIQAEPQMTAIPSDAETQIDGAEAVTPQRESSPPMDGTLQLFQNPNWEAWKAFLLPI